VEREESVGKPARPLNGWPFSGDTAPKVGTGTRLPCRPLQWRDLSNQDTPPAAMTPTFFTGLDLHKRSVTATTLGADGALVATARMPCRAPALRAYFAQLPGEHAATVECTTGWYWVKDALADAVDLHLAHAKGVKAIASAKVKTDAADSRMLAHLLRADLLPRAHMIADELRPLRDVLRTRLRLVERRVAAQNSIARLLEKHNVRDVSDLNALGQLQARCHLDQAEMLHVQIKRLEKALHPHLVPDEDVQRLLRVPGIGKACAFTIRLEVDDIARFETERHFFSYCRVVPGADNSGERVRHKRSRDGNRYLKMAFSHAAVRAVQYYPEVRAWYGSKKRKKPDVVARALVAKEIARIVYHVLTKREDFNGRFKGVALSRAKKEQWPLLPSPASITGDGEGSGPRPPLAGMGR
jgi:transposase